MCILAVVLVLLGCARNRPWLDNGSLVVETPPPIEKQSFRFLKRDIKGRSVTSLKELASLPDEEIDIARGALLVSKEVDPELDIDKYLGVLDKMAKELAEYLKQPLAPRQIVENFRLYLFHNKRFKLLRSKELLETERMNNTLLDKVLDLSAGNCSGLSLLYLCLAERLGVPLAMVAIPAYSTRNPPHAFVRYLGKAVRLNIETTDQGRIVSDSSYMKDFGPALKMRPRAFETELSKKQVIAVIACNAAARLYKMGNFAETLSLLEKTVALWPNDVDMLIMLGATHARLKNRDKAIMYLEKARLLAPKDFLPRYSLFSQYLGMKEKDKAVELGKEFLKLYPGHPDSDFVQLVLLYFLANPKIKTKYRLQTLAECDAAIEFVRSYPERHKDRTTVEDKSLKILPSLLQQRRRELLEQKKQDSNDKQEKK